MKRFLHMRKAARVHGFNIRVPSEVLVVERQNVLDGMRQHRCYKTCVVKIAVKDCEIVHALRGEAWPLQ